MKNKMSDLPNCPKCSSEYTYQDVNIYICPECAHEWSTETEEKSSESDTIIRDSNGNPLQDGDTVTVIKP